MMYAVLSTYVRANNWVTFSWEQSGSWISFQCHRFRWVLATLILLFSVADLVLTQTILTMVEEITGSAVGEANALMAPIVMTWWAWPIRVGVPLIIVIRDMKNGNYNLMLAGTILYGAVVAWNTHMYQIVSAQM
jgi:hypothetical protein